MDMLDAPRSLRNAVSGMEGVPIYPAKYPTQPRRVGVSGSPFRPERLEAAFVEDTRDCRNGASDFP